MYIINLIKDYNYNKEKQNIRNNLSEEEKWYIEMEKKEKLELTSEMIEMIKEDIKDDIYFDVRVSQRLNSYLSDYNKIKDVVIENQKQTDKYTYTLYCKYYYLDNYNKMQMVKVKVTYNVKEDKTSKTGFYLDMNIKLDN